MKPYTWDDLERDLAEWHAWWKEKPKWWQIRARHKWKKADPTKKQEQRRTNNG